MATGNYRNGSGGGVSFSNGGSGTSLKGSLYSSNSNSNSNGSKLTTPTSSDRQIPSSVNSVLKSTAPSIKPKPRRSSTGSTAAGSNNHNHKYDPGVPGRVRVAVRLRPRNAEESVADSDLPDCVELQPELKRLKLRRNNWDSDTFEFDEVLTEFASQKRVYEVVAKPVVESVLEGYNGTVMAYGQTGTGKTYTLGLLGDEDTSARGIMVRALEDILAEISPATDSVSVSYLQLYMETIQDLLRPENDNISIVEDPKTGDLSLPGATSVEIKDQKSFVELLRLGDAHRFAANTKLNTESSRSHAILMVHVKRSIKGKDSALANENGNLSHSAKPSKPIIRRGKFVVVDLAGSERIDKSGSEGHTLEEAKSINLSLSSLGKCINALAENSPHVPVRDSKLTRLLRDSFGGSARTSLVITIGPSPRHRGETASTIMFGQRAMKVENMLKIKEEFDYKSLSRRLDIQLDKLIAENERKQKAFQDEIDRIALEAQKHIAEVERNYADTLEKERLRIEKEYLDLTEKLQEQLLNNQGKHANSKVGSLLKDDSNDKIPDGQYPKLSAELDEVKQLLQNETVQRQAAEKEVFNLRNQLAQWEKLEAAKSSDILKLRKMLEDESHEKTNLQEEIVVLQNQLLQISFEADETRRKLDKEESQKLSGDLSSLISEANHQSLRDLGDGEKTSMAKLFEQVGLQKILSLLDSDDADVRIHAVKVVANLAAEESNQERIVEAGGLTSLLMLLRSCDDETIQRVAAGALANLGMNETNQELIVSQGGINLLSMTAANADDPQTLRMVAGAIANLCGNDKLRVKLRAEGGIKALLGMVRCRHPDVLAQVARGIANFAKCESRAFTQGAKMGKSLLIEDGALPWIVQNANNEASPIRRHVELALCHLAQYEANAKDMITAGALWELVRISRDCSRDDIRNLAYKTLTSIPSFIAELKRQRIDYG